LIIVGLNGCVETGQKTVTYAELLSDVDEETGSLQSYKPNDVVSVRDTVFNMTYQEVYLNGVQTPVTTIMLHNGTLGGLVFFEDLRSTYIVGNTYTIPVHVKEYTIQGTTIIWLEEWYNVHTLAYNMTPPPSETTPAMILSMTDSSQINTLTVGSVNEVDWPWADFELLVNESVTDHGMTGNVTEGDVIDLTSIAGTGAYNVSLRYIPTGSLMGVQYKTFEFTAGS
jgi:hypothetical protein